MKRILSTALVAAFLCIKISAQVPSPSIPLTGNIGAGGIFPLFNAGPLIFSSDASRTMAYPEMSAFVIKAVSSVTLTATRNLIAPNGYFAFAIENATTGGQSIQIIGATGTGVTIPNCSVSPTACTAFVFGDGTNYYSVGSSAGGSMTYPVAGIPNSNGSSWLTSYSSSNFIPANYISALAYMSYFGSFTVGHCLQVESISPITAQDAGLACGSGSGITQLTGDGAAGPGSGSQPLTLTTVNGSPGTYGSASATPVLTVDVKGRITSISTVPTTAAPPVNYIFYPAAVEDGGSAFAGGCTRYDNNQPQAGSIASATSALGYLSFNAPPTQPQYCEFTRTEPAYWTGTSLSVDFFAAATSGNVIFDVQSVCLLSNTALTSSYSPTFGTVHAVTTAVSTTAYGLVTSAVLSNVAAPGVGNCPASPTTPTQVTYRIYLDASTTIVTNLLGFNVGVGRSQ